MGYTRGLGNIYRKCVGLQYLRNQQMGYYDENYLWNCDSLYFQIALSNNLPDLYLKSSFLMIWNFMLMRSHGMHNFTNVI